MGQNPITVTLSQYGTSQGFSLREAKGQLDNNLGVWDAGESKKALETHRGYRQSYVDHVAPRLQQTTVCKPREPNRESLVRGHRRQAELLQQPHLNATLVEAHNYVGAGSSRRPPAVEPNFRERLRCTNFRMRRILEERIGVLAV